MSARHLASDTRLWLVTWGVCLLAGCAAPVGPVGPVGAGMAPTRAEEAPVYRRAARQAAGPEAAADGTRAEHISSSPRRTPNLVVISIDGLRPDAIDRYSARTLQRLLREGAYSLEAETVSPSKTLPAHTSMLTGIPPAEHGVVRDFDEAAARGMATASTVFEVAAARGIRSAAFVSKSKFHHLFKPGTLEHSEVPSSLNSLLATETVEAAVRYLRHRRPELIFIHIAEPDYAGHTIGWMSTVYGWAVRRADGAVARLLREADRAYGAGNYTILITSDHGGHGRTHGTSDPLDTTIPWIAWGYGVRPGELPPRSIRTEDTAATIVWLLGADRPAGWSGRPIRAAFVERASQS